VTQWRETPAGEKQWLSADGFWYPTESAALLAGLQSNERPPLAPTPSAVASQRPSLAPSLKQHGNMKQSPLAISLPGAVYLGGHPSQKRRATGNLIVRAGVLGIGVVRTPTVAKILLSPGLPVRVESAVVSKSRAGKALAFGVLALAAQNQQNAAYLTVEMGNGVAVTYEVKGMTGPELAARLRGPLGECGVRI
jgi:hypothetical protein